MSNDTMREALGDSDLHYLRSILRHLREFKQCLPDETAFSLGSEAFHDNIDWLDCFIDKHERAPRPSPDTSALDRAYAALKPFADKLRKTKDDNVLKNSDNILGTKVSAEITFGDLRRAREVADELRRLGAKEE